LGVNSGTVYFITVCAANRNTNVLASARVAGGLWKNVCFCHARGDWFPHLFVVMPDHVHGLFSFPPESQMQKVITAWKKFTAHALDIEWQRDFFDHRLRREESFEEKASYICDNPVRAELVKTESEWPYIWRMNRYGD
jgi:REP element-mobilizing transposase RayT